MRWPSTTTVMSGRTGDPVASITFTCLKAKMGSEAEEEVTMVASERIPRKTLAKALCMATSSDWQISEKLETDLKNKMVRRNRRSGRTTERIRTRDAGRFQARGERPGRIRPFPDHSGRHSAA